jgi:hypothetical protein
LSAIFGSAGHDLLQSGDARDVTLERETVLGELHLVRVLLGRLLVGLRPADRLRLDDLHRHALVHAPFDRGRDQVFRFGDVRLVDHVAGRDVRDAALAKPIIAATTPTRSTLIMRPLLGGYIDQRPGALAVLGMALTGVSNRALIAA